MAGILDKVANKNIDRRTFVGAAAAVGVTASLGLTGCENKVVDATEESPTVASLEGGEWKTFRCPQDGCTTHCVNQAYVVDGIMVRQRTDELSPDSIDNPQIRGCIKGRSVRKTLTAPDRLKYPMKRKNWMPGGGDNVNGHLRGIDEWERITWDEAIDYITEEFTRVSEAYGPRAFLGMSFYTCLLNNGYCGSKIFNLMGGCLTTYGHTTRGGLMIPFAFIGGGFGLSLDRMALRHTKLEVFFGNNTAWIMQNQMYNVLNAKKEAGTKVVIIDSWLSPTSQAIADVWIPIRPSTDGALIEALAYELIVNNWVDQEFLDTYCVGFDAEHMPADAKTNENYKDYILGAYDGQARTPEWASPITGVPVETIKELAKDMGTTKPMYMKFASSLARTYYGNRFTHQFATLAWMCGAAGELGASYAVGLPHGTTSSGAVTHGNTEYTLPPNPICTEAGAGGRLSGGDFDPSLEYGIAFAEVHKAMATGEYTLPGPAHEKRACDIKVVYADEKSNMGNQQTGIQWAEEGYRNVDFVLMQDLYIKGSSVYADILLPVKSFPEMEFSYNRFTNSEMCGIGTNAIPTYYECKDDSEIYFLMCDAMGFGEDVAPRSSSKQSMFEMLKTTMVPHPDGTKGPIVSVSEDDLDYFELTGETQDGLIPLREFMEDRQGIYKPERAPDDGLVGIALKDFIADPVANPQKTTSGKLEIYCQAMKDFYDTASFHDIDALPKYKAPVDGYEQITPDSEYRYQCVNQHHMRQVNSNYANNKVLTEVFANDLMMSNYDAEREGFKKGDWVLVSGKDAGQIVRRINVVPYVAPGMVLMGQGNHTNIDPETGIDIGGNINSLVRPQLLGDGYQAYNTVLLKIEPYQGKTMLPDFEVPYVVPIAE